MNVTDRVLLGTKICSELSLLDLAPALVFASHAIKANKQNKIYFCIKARFKAGKSNDKCDNLASRD